MKAQRQEVTFPAPALQGGGNVVNIMEVQAHHGENPR
jgi:hypothetical protein